MSPWVILVAVYGATTVWLESYQPWLLSRVNPDVVTDEPAPPFAVLLAIQFLRRYGVDAVKKVGEKPWKCGLCMSFLVALPLWLCSLWTPTQCVVIGFAGVGAWRFLDIDHRYKEVITGK